jgi:Na+-transporting NADH:ubiquinone oxidoreductase subunit NqrC
LKNRECGGMSFPAMVLCIVLLLLGAVGYKEFGKWQKKADEQKVIAAAADVEKTKAAAVAKAEEGKAIADEKAAQANADADVTQRAADLAAYNSDTTAMDKAFQEFLDAKKVAHSTSRIGLATPVLALQAARRKFLDLQVGKCLDGAKQTLAASMASAVSGFTIFMSNEAGMGALDASDFFENHTKQRNAGVIDMALCKPRQ